MGSIKLVVGELVGMFVADWTLTIMVLIWLLLATRVLPAWLPAAAWAGPVLFAGCAAILAFSVWRRAVPPGRR